MGKNRGGVRNKVKKRKAHLNSMAQKLQTELDHLTNFINEKTPKTTTHSGKIIKVINANKSEPPQRASLPVLKKKCPQDCEGLLYNVFC